MKKISKSSSSTSQSKSTNNELISRNQHGTNKAPTLNSNNNRSKSTLSRLSDSSSPSPSKSSSSSKDSKVLHQKKGNSSKKDQPIIKDIKQNQDGLCKQNENLWSLSFKIIPSDIVILIIDFMEPVMFPTCSEGKLNRMNFSKLCKQWFGRFSLDNTIQLVFRYGRVSSQNVEESLFLLASQRQFHNANNQFWENNILKGLVYFPLFEDPPMNEYWDKKKRAKVKSEFSQKQNKKVYDRMNKFKLAYPDFCNSLKNLDLLDAETSIEYIGKCFEIFPNFEYLRLRTLGPLFPNLEDFSFRGPRVVELSDGLGVYPSLKSYSHHLVSYNNIYSNNAEEFAGFGRNNKFFSHLHECPSITSLTVRGEGVNGTLLQTVGTSLPNLTHLDLLDTNTFKIELLFTDSLKIKSLTIKFACEELKKLKPTLEYLRIGRYSFIWGTRSLFELNNLKTLVIDILAGFNLEFQEMVVEKLPNLEVLLLTLEYTTTITYSIDEANRFFMEKLKRLKRLSIENERSRLNTDSFQ